jgi:hypothetical protein
VVIGRASERSQDAVMQLIQPTHVLRPARAPIVLGTLVGGVLFFGGVVLAWIAFATPFVRVISPTVVRPAPDQMAFGALIWGVSLVAPPCFAIVGLLRLSSVAAVVFKRPKLGAVGAITGDLDDAYVVAPTVRLPEGRIVRNVIVGPFGMAVLSEAPSSRNTRRQGRAWERRGADGRWMPTENPLDRCTRDMERIKGWIGSEERDFVVKVFAAVVTDDQSLSRTPACAVIGTSQVAAWLNSLPPQRSLNESRRADLIELVRSIT